MASLLQRHTTRSTPTPSSPSSEPIAYVAQSAWCSDRPNSLVVCCSDGRLQESTDEFLQRSLGIVYYDRLYTPGGPGALSNRSCEFTRANQYRTELQFLLRAHSFRQVVLLFHGAGADGPEHSICAHYRRLMSGSSNEEIGRRHLDDMEDVLNYLHDLSPSLEIRVFRAEVMADLHVRFVDLAP